MNTEPGYFRYVVAQYVHSRREERLNVGVVVHDPLRSTVRSQFDTKTATRRIKTAFPDVDAKGLTAFLRDLGEAVMSNPSLNSALDQPDALARFGSTWRNAIQFTGVRSVPAANITEAVNALAKLYVADVPPQLHQVPAARGIPYAVSRTKQALRDVLQLEEGLNYNAFKSERLIVHGGRVHRVLIEFPFLVFDEFLIDTLSFRGDSYPAKFDVASGFVQKVESLRRTEEGRRLQPCISYVFDEDRREETEGLLAQIQDVTQLPDERIVEATHAEDLARYIGAHRAA